ncbi:CDGSH iron-sulfur domain-containing protein [Streptomyces sp. B1866]|uniref:CDGSH iron-sulfur domain-containing protein n=1 Tax=Streptomyces sp. B1866 TaxID=3075431 RepID=UPI002891AF78|nr:CDGSH iron-sulfur domain-containing protein [Streptomyces sp. B1866]MDT3400615.1 CDGSH iron-sulfur domain-containing protein [Streptomyces sp. B1866]
MPCAPDGPGEPVPAARRVVIDPEGPLLVEGPVEVTLADGGTARSDRVMVAVCACGHSARYPWCDTSHRRLAAADGRRSGTRCGEEPGSA